MTTDYIIIGAGSAGCVLANRLTADPAVKVTLLEAGGPDTKLEIKVPAAFNKLFKTAVDWNYATVPQARMNDRQLYIPRGKTLGGSSSINAMIYIRGNAADYDQWAANGASGWAYADLLPYFKRSEHQTRGASEYHGTEGPLNVTDLRLVNPLTTCFIAAGEAVGIPRNPDFNGASQIGVGTFQVTQKNGQRWSEADAFLRPAQSRPNLTVLTGALATQLVMEGTAVRGVTYIRNNQKTTLYADREVILCGGAINSPQLLLLSGIGPADHLRAIGITVNLDLPGVGENLQDHLVVPVCFNATKPISLDKADSIGNLIQFLLFKRGQVTSNVAEAGGFVKLKTTGAAPDLQFHFGPAFFFNHGFTPPGGFGFTAGPTLLHPLSRGTIRLRSADPSAAPAIDPHFLERSEDLDLLIEGVKLTRSVLKAAPFDPYRGTEYMPGEDVTTDAAIADHIRKMGDTIYHPVGTCKMGTDAAAVVDPHLRVRGITGLRIVDASVMPTVTSGNTNAPTIMIAEKAADLILQGR